MGKVEKITSNLIELAQTAHGNFKHAAAITQGSKILSTGVNDGRRTKWRKSVKPCFHAEIAAIASFQNKFKCFKRRSNLTLWVIRIPSNKTKLTHFRDSMPCGDCYREAKKLGINTLKYSNAEGKIVSVKFKNFFSNYLTTGQRCIY